MFMHGPPIGLSLFEWNQFCEKIKTVLRDCSFHLYDSVGMFKELNVKKNRTTLISSALLQLLPRCSVAASTYIRLPVPR